MKIPNSGRKKALLVVDVQPVFMRPHVLPVIPKIVSLIEQVPYDFYVEALFHAEKGSLWDRQQNWSAPQDEHMVVMPEVEHALASHNPLKVIKQTKSLFKGNQDILKAFKQHAIEEVHIIGVDTNDCVIATTFEAFDLGFFSYVIEECCQSDQSNEAHELGLQILRLQKSTNNSCLEPLLDISL